VISLEQVRQLDIRVKKAVTAVKTFSAENSALKKQNAELEARLDELRREASDRKADEEQLEVSLQGVLDVLDEVNGETSEVEPEPPADNYVIETVPEPELGADEESVETDEPEQDIVFAPDNSEDDNSTVPDSSEIESVEVESVSEDNTEQMSDDTESDIPEAAALQTAELEEETAEIETKTETESEEISLESDDSDDTDQFQSEFDIF
jgi:hypothetical protein